MVKRVSLKASTSAPSRSSGPNVARSMRVPDGLNKVQFDSLQNLITGLGTSKDKMMGTTFVFNEMNKGQLEMAYRSDWIARKVVDIPAQDATREWRSWQSDTKDTNLIEELERTTFLQKKVKAAMQKARLYGGGALLLGVNNGKLEEELIPEKVGKGALKFIHVVSRWELSAGELEWEIDSEYYGQPKYYTRAGGSGLESGQRIHPSRVVRFLGSEVPDPTLGMGWGDSSLQVVQDAVMSASLVTASGSQLMNELKMDVIKIPDLASSLSKKEYAQRLSDRFALANVAKSLYNILLLDKDEEWERITANLQGMPDVLRMYLLIASGAADIPATRMLGQSPQGLSATGESDMRNYYDKVKSEQATVQQPAMTKLDEILIRSALGTTNPQDVVYIWNPLWQVDDQQRTTIMKQKAEAFKVDVDAGLIPSEVLRDARINQLLEDGTYPGLEQILEDYGPLEPIDDTPPGVVLGPDGKPIPAQAVDPNAPPVDPNAPPKKTGKVLPFSKKGTKKSATGDMAARIRRAQPRTKKYRAMDGVMRTLYVYRPVLNTAEILAWAKGVVPNLVPASELHVTIMYSRTPVDWAKTGEAWSQDENGNLTVKPGGMRALQKFGNAIVLCFNSSELGWRHCQIKENTGATWDYAEYQPHITLAYMGPDDEPVDLNIEAYQGAIEFGPEVYAEASGNPMTQDERGNPYQGNAA